MPRQSSRQHGGSRSDDVANKVLNDLQLRSLEVDATAYADYLATDSDALTRAAAGALERRVPGCPDWDVATLVDHVGRIHRWVAAMVRTSATERLDRERMPSGLRGETHSWHGACRSLFSAPACIGRAYARRQRRLRFALCAQHCWYLPRPPNPP